MQGFVGNMLADKFARCTTGVNWVGFAQKAHNSVYYAFSILMCSKLCFDFLDCNAFGMFAYTGVVDFYLLIRK